MIQYTVHHLMALNQALARESVRDNLNTANKHHWSSFEAYLAVSLERCQAKRNLYCTSTDADIEISQTTSIAYQWT